MSNKWITFLVTLKYFSILGNQVVVGLFEGRLVVLLKQYGALFVVV